MIEPTDKAPEIDKLISGLMGKDRKSTIEGAKCMTCKAPNLNFRDPLSRKEYAISGMCQRCQDETFGV